MLHRLLSTGYQIIFYFGGLVCHQRPERSPHLFGVQMPLCWRCSGILIGALLLFIWLLATKRLPSLLFSLAFAVLMPLDVLTAMAGLWSGHNSLRLITGLLWGWFGTSLCLQLLRREDPWWHLLRYFHRRDKYGPEPQR
jgi:uncharacterized membrane protein